jgi:uncharacterized protein (TIGR03437 family)
MRIICIVFVLFLRHSELFGQAAFFRRDMPVGDRPSTVVGGDFNGDSRPDLAVNSFLGLSVLLNTGGGSFARPLTIPAEIHPMFGPTPAQYTLAADFNRDGRLDLVGAVDATDPPLRRVLRLLLGRSDGTFTQRDIESGQLVVAGTGDFNGDRIPDLVIEAKMSLIVLLGNGEGAFQHGARISASGSGTRVAEFNRDGFSDVAANLPQSRLGVWLNRGDGTFRPPVETSDAGVGVVADFNRDGIPDIATGTEVLLGKGDGTFQAIRYIPSRRGFPIPFAAGDLDGDGQIDLMGWLYNEAEPTYLSISRGRGDGTLSLPVDLVVGWQATGQAAADMDGDGRPDVVTSNFRSNTVTLLMPRTAGAPNLNRAVSAASGTATVAAESLASLFMSTGTATTEIAAAPYPAMLGGIGLEVRDSAGATGLAPLLFVSPTQINFQVPAGTAFGEAALILTNDRAPTPVGGMQVDAVAPALFMLSHANSTPAALGVRVAADGQQTPVPVFNCSGPPVASPFFCGPAPMRLAGDPIYLSFYATGFRGADSSNVTASVNAVRLPVAYAGPQGTPGVDQINVRLLPEAALGPPGFVTLRSTVSWRIRRCFNLFGDWRMFTPILFSPARTEVLRIA